MLVNSTWIGRMRIKTNQGFTIVEILVATVIFAFAVLGLAAGTVTLTRTNADTHSRANAINVAQARLEELKAMNNTTITTVAAACTAFTSVGCNDTSSVSGMAFTRRWRIVTNSPVTNVNRIEVQVDWTDHGNRSLTISTAVPQ